MGCLPRYNVRTICLLRTSAPTYSLTAQPSLRPLTQNLASATLWAHKMTGVYSPHMNEFTKHLEEQSQRNWEMHHQIKTDSFKEANRIIFWVDTGSFGVSLAFLSFLDNPGNLIFVFLSWTFFILSIYFLIISHESTGLASIRAQHLINAWRGVEGKVDASLGKSIKPDMSITDQEFTEREAEARAWRKTALILMVAGLISVAVFALGNIL